MKIFIKASQNKNCVPALDEIKNIITKYGHTYIVSTDNPKQDEMYIEIIRSSIKRMHIFNEIDNNPLGRNE